jgi:hypothetical protein
MEFKMEPSLRLPRVVENYAGQPCYLVDYDEDQWERYDQEGKEFCFERWAQKAKPMGCVFVILRLIPDPLFPRGTKTVPYVARSYPVEQATFNPITVTACITGSIHRDTWARASEGERFKLKIQARQHIAMHALAAAGVHYVIDVWEGDELKVVERGRL